MTLGLLALGGASAAHATEYTGNSCSVLETSLLTRSGNEGGCGVDPSKPGEEGGWHEDGPKEDGPRVDGPRDGWFGGRYYRDGKDCSPPVVPLPPSSLLLVSGALALLILGRRRRPATA